MDPARLWGALALAGAVTLAAPSPLAAWGYTGHWLVVQGAVDNLPDEMFDDGTGNGFDAWRDEIADFAGHADFMRNFDPNERDRHTLSLDVNPEDYPPPFDTIPRDQATYEEIFGRGYGVVPWEGVRDHMEGLTQAFRAHNWPAARRAAADLAHYVADSAQPLHTTVNFDGERTGNDGIHARYEEDFIERFVGFGDLVTRRSALPLEVDVELIENPVEYTFEELVAAHGLVDSILEADTVARRADPTFRDVYYEMLSAQVRLETVGQINDAARRAADLWYTAWINAGQPDFDPEPIALLAPEVQPTIDGALGEFTGMGVLQTNITDQGDNLNELDQLQLAHSDDDLVIGLSGNHGDDHTLAFLFDTVDGGTNPLQLPEGLDALSALDGLELRPGFEPDFILALENVGGEVSVRLINLKLQTVTFMGEAREESFTLFPDGEVCRDNSNTGGVRDRAGGTVISASDVRTGLEISLPMRLLDIGPLGGGEVRVMAILLEMSSGSAITNQMLPGFPLGEFEPNNGASRCPVSAVGWARFTLEGWAELPHPSGISLQ